MFALFLISCVQDLAAPFLGDCAQYPDESYDYGQIGIGTCLSGPSDIQFVQSGASTQLIISNANPYLNYDSGSLLLLDWAGVDTTTTTQYMHELNAQAIPIDTFSGEIESNGSWITVSSRYSEDARSLEDEDSILQFSLENGELRSVGSITVGADPLGTAYDKSSGYLFVVNESSKDISIIDTTLDDMEVIPPWPEQIIRDVEYEGNGHLALAQLDALSEEQLGEVEELPTLSDDLFSLTWLEGSSTLWVPSDNSWTRIEYFGNETFQESLLGPELRPEDNLIVSSISDPVYFGNAMLFSDENSIYSALRATQGSWEYDPTPLMTLDIEQLAGFAYGQEGNTSFVLYAAQSEKGWGLFSEEPNSTGTQQELLFTDETPIRDPSLVFDNASRTWLLTYSKEDPVLGWQIWRAKSIDRETWIFDNEPMFEDAIAPHTSAVLAASESGIHMWYARKSLGGWEYIHSFSANGNSFVELETIPSLIVEEPQKLALSLNPNETLRVSSASTGNIIALPPTATYLSMEHGWEMTSVVGAWEDISLYNNDSKKGLRIDSVWNNTAYLTINNGAGLRQMATASIQEDLHLTPKELLFPNEDKEQYSPVLWADGDRIHLVYTERVADQSRLMHTTSEDGTLWDTAQEITPPQTEEIEANCYQNGTLWLSQEDSNGWNAYTMDVDSWTISSTLGFSRGDIGSWDDNGIKDIFIEGEEGERRLYYSGFDGINWQMGMATEENGWIRYNEEEPTIMNNSGFFFSSDSTRFIRIPQSDSFYFSGIHNDVSRIGLGEESLIGQARPNYNLPNTGDVLSFETQEGSEEQKSIPLDVDINGVNLSGTNIAQASVDTERGLLFVTSRQLPYIMVVDIRDDSDDTFTDRNYLKLETTLTFLSTSGAAGFRQTIVQDNILYALNDAPEGIFAIDLNLIEDNQIHELIQVPPIDIIPTPRGSESDEGAQTRASVGPSRIAIQPNGVLMAVSNFNTNSIGFYDRTLGRAGTEIYELPLDTENPHALQFSPDGNQLVVATYTGDMDGLAAHAQLVIIDTDPSSPTYLHTQTRIKNR